MLGRMKMNMGVRIINNGREERQPIVVQKTASYALPSNRSLCPGRIDSADSSGAPRKIEGMKSINVWVIARDTINIAIVNGERCKSKKARLDRTSAETRFICIHGVRPVTSHKFTQGL